jgi:hypothetical protein
MKREIIGLKKFEMKRYKKSKRDEICVVIGFAMCKDTIIGKKQLWDIQLN